MLSQAAVVKVKNALAKGYIGTAKVYEYTKTTSASTHVSTGTETQVLNNIPCRLSFSSSDKASGGDVAEVTQVIKLFFAPTYTIKAGSKVVVTQNGVTTAYVHSGKETIYDTHKEAVLELFERWA